MKALFIMQMLLIDLFFSSCTLIEHLILHGFSAYKSTILEVAVVVVHVELLLLLM